MVICAIYALKTIEIRFEKMSAIVLGDPSGRVLQLCQILDDPSTRKAFVFPDASEIDDVERSVGCVFGDHEVSEIKILMVHSGGVHSAGESGDGVDESPTGFGVSVSFVCLVPFQQQREFSAVAELVNLERMAGVVLQT